MTRRARRWLLALAGVGCLVAADRVLLRVLAEGTTVEATACRHHGEGEVDILIAGDSQIPEDLAALASALGGSASVMRCPGATTAEVVAQIEVMPRHTLVLWTGWNDVLRDREVAPSASRAITRRSGFLMLGVVLTRPIRAALDNREASGRTRSPLPDTARREMAVTTGHLAAVQGVAARADSGLRIFLVVPPWSGAEGDPAFYARIARSHQLGPGDLEGLARALATTVLVACAETPGTACLPLAERVTGERAGHRLQWFRDPLHWNEEGGGLAIRWLTALLAEGAPARDGS